MTNLFNQLANEFKGDFTYETTNKYFNVEISVCFWTTEIEVRYYAGTLLSPIKREKYNELYDKIQSFTSLRIPFFAYDFDEKYTNKFIQKRYPINNDRYLIYEKEIINGIITKNYYIEYNGKLKIISENMIKKLKDEYYEKKIQEYKLQEQKSSELKTSLLKDNLINTVLPK
jgi:hypothetical protein